MKILAIEQSTRRGTVSILEDDILLSEHDWDEEYANKHLLFKALKDIFNELSMQPADVDLFAVGTGPGAFSGIRISLSAANAMAVPDHKTVTGVSSGKALAYDIRGEFNSPSVTVVGDARRNTLWMAEFSKESETDYSLVKPEELAAEINLETIVVSPDWDRIGETLLKSASPETRIVPEPVFPCSTAIGLIAFENFKCGNISPPLPIYMHPPTTVKPREQRTERNTE